MTKQPGVAVIGAGMVGRSHVNRYHQTSIIHSDSLPPIRLVAVADINQELAVEMAGRYSLEKAAGSQQRIADDPETNVVSVVAGDSLHREVVEALFAAGRHVLCKKSLADTLANAEAMVAAAEKAGTVVATAYSSRRNPTAEAIHDLLTFGEPDDPIPTEAHYLADYACDPTDPMGWRLRDDLGSGAFTDPGAHITDLAEYIAEPIVFVAETDFTISIRERNLPLGNVIGHGHVEPSDEKEVATNDDSTVFTATFTNSAATTFRTSRAAYGSPSGLTLTTTGTQSRTVLDWCRPVKFVVSDNQPNVHTCSDWVVYVDPDTATVFDDAVPIPGDNISLDYGGLFIYQIRAFLDQVSGRESRLPVCVTLTDGLHTMKILDIVTYCYHSGGARTIA